MTQTIELEGIKLTVKYEYYYYKGIWFISDDLEELIIESIHTEGDIMELLENYSKSKDLMNDIREKLLPYARDTHDNPE